MYFQHETNLFYPMRYGANYGNLCTIHLEGLEHMRCGREQ